MTTISISRYLDKSQFEKLEKIWNAQENVNLIFPENLSAADVEHIFGLLLPTLPNDFSFCILGNLAEGKNVSTSLLARLFDFGDTGCNVSICLRDNLSEEIMERCKNSDDDDVREHFLSRQRFLKAKE